jgi:hypothetical protein
MTIAIGAYFRGGMIVCADTNVVATDFVVTSGCKISARDCRNGDSYVIANASDDGNAGNMLSQEILDALSRHSAVDLEQTVKTTMGNWHSGYAQGTAPQMSFVLAAMIGTEHRRLYFCGAPNTVLPKPLGEPVVIGIGAQIVDPLIPSVITSAVPLRIALLQVAYLMYRAKRDHIYLRGSETDAMVLARGEVHEVNRGDMADAEKLGPEIDNTLHACFMGLIGQLKYPPDQQATINRIGETIYLACADKCEALEFRSINYLF